MDSHRLWIRIGLVLGILVLGGVLVALWTTDEQREAPPALSRTQMRVQFVDGDGDPVPKAQVFVLRDPDEQLEESWAPGEATLTLGPVTRPRTVLAIARGYRMQVVRDLADSTRVTMEPGYKVHVGLRNAPKALEERHIRFLIRIRPHEDLVAKTPGMTSESLVDLMAHTAGRRSGPRGLPRGAFGYAVSRTQARKGILVPAGGRYRVHWGLMDLKAGTWFSLGDECGRAVRVDAGGEQYVLDVTEGHLDRTLEGLKSSVNRLTAGDDEDE